MFINPGELKRVVTFKKKVGEDDWSVETTKDTVCQCWAKVTPISGKQFWEAQSVGTSITHEVYIRYREDVDASMLIEYKGREFDIVYIANIEEEGQYLKILAKEKVFQDV